MMDEFVSEKRDKAAQPLDMPWWIGLPIYVAVLGTLLLVIYTIWMAI